MNTVIIKKDDKYYFTSEDRVYELNESNMNRLKIHLSLPSKVYFRNCPFSFIGSLVSSIFEEPVDLNVSRVKDTKDYEATFTKTKNIRL